MEVVVDTNVLINGLFCIDPHAARILDLISNGTLKMVYSEGIRKEYAYILGKKFPEFLSAENLLQLRILLENSKMVSPSFNLIISSDPSDNMFMECAVCAKANAFITSDYKNDLIRLAIYRSVRICDPATFLREKGFLHLKIGVLT
ncbi:putative toxin-antitoxin system toxin component, PIN family [Thermanaerosceptrum fracticalcis]|uniref:Putative toxin-antitoxin system toxin component, PIN family n=1 Tax=Thermanaerosceptrum fracticalcis TaxID=1712410 RepID=A0A7G6E096_THEFR|nr:putative toxin-antitoxin system toxin component, PIN family [Thermanaerosceptrum fracticalcis]QNB45500.1 putative toxin-antitoxin system toxin component, PIN family [Thermanaerosceptrum fracticalcis]